MNDKEKQERLLEMMREEQMQSNKSEAPPKNGKVGLSSNKTLLYSISASIILCVPIFLLGIFDDRNSKLRDLSETLVNVKIYRFMDSLKSISKNKGQSGDFTSNGVLKIGKGRWHRKEEGYWDCLIDGVFYSTIDVEGTEKVKNYMKLIYQELIDRGITSEELARFKRDRFWGLDLDNDPRWEGFLDYQH